MKFMLIMRDNPGMFAGLSEADMPAVVEEYVDWTKQMRTSGCYLGGHKLVTGEPGRIIRHGTGGVEIEEGAGDTGGLVGGTMILEAGDYPEVCGLTQSNPQLKYGGTIEVRQIDEI
jgi:hypothetical protein